MVMQVPTRVSELFGGRNDKLGEVLTFSLPAIKTCPGASGLCKKACYALKGRYYGHYVQNFLQRNHEISQHPDFHKVAVQVLNNSKRRGAKLLRVHPSGDLYDAEYTRKWLYIMQNVPHYTFWLYTRSWRVDSIYDVLVEMAELPNAFIWFSCDDETGRPITVPPNVRLAYMMVDSADEPRWEPDLYFRDYPMRDTVTKNIRGTLVCPVENGVSHTTCSKCRVCCSDPEQDPTKRTRGRFALSTVN